MTTPTSQDHQIRERTSAPQGFALISEHEIPILKLTVQHYRHHTGAEHYHLAADDEHRAFVVSFRTVPGDSTGLPHILEHLVLCGSERYPVRDPFFMMIRRSLNTFMNAMTGADCTYYPFSSQVPKDFDNLLSIYLDATFRPNLHALDFAQEGYRIEPEEGPGASVNGHAATAAAIGAGVTDRAEGSATSNGAATSAPPSGWAFKGVVYNEMKGAMGNTDALIFQASDTALQPATPYRFNSGGDPAVIPSLTHQDLVDFHARHYCAANACFSTYGKLDVDALHARFEPYLSARLGQPIPLPAKQPAFDAPIAQDVPVPLEAGQDPVDVSQVRLSWLWDEGCSIDASLVGDLLEMLLTGHAGAPLRLALESSGLGRALGWGGFMTVGHHGGFTTALKGVDPERYDEFEPLVMGCLEEIAETGFPGSEVEAALHQLEINRRTITGDRFPFGLELAFRATEAWRQEQDPIPFLDLEPALERLRERAQAPGFWTALVRERFLDHPHRVLLRAIPDAGYNTRLDAEERERLNARMATLDAEDRARLLQEARDLAERQATEDDVSVLPELLLSDVPEQRAWAQGRVAEDGLEVFDTGTNGILHQIAAFPLGRLETEDLPLLSLLTTAMGSLGVGENDYRAHAARLNAICGGIGVWSDIRGDLSDRGHIRGHLFLEVSGLARRIDEWSGLLVETLLHQRFDEHERMLELARQSLAGLQQRVAFAGHDLASAAATRGFGGRAGMSHDLGGLGRLAWLKALEKEARQDAGKMAELCGRLEALLARLRQAPVRLALIGDAAADAAVIEDLRNTWEGWERPAAFTAGSADLEAPRAHAVPATAFTTASQVNYCALAFSTPPLAHPDAAALAVAARYLSNNHLHAHLREKGGAYGGRSGFSASTGVFSLTSYRDPRLDGTYADMRSGLAMLQGIDDDARLLREAILGVIGGIDRPASPSGEARRRFVGDLFGYGPETMNAYRARVLETTSADIRRVAAAHLPPEGGSRALVTGDAQLDASQLEWERQAL